MLGYVGQIERGDVSGIGSQTSYVSTSLGIRNDGVCCQEKIIIWKKRISWNIQTSYLLLEFQLLKENLPTSSLTPASNALAYQDRLFQDPTFPLSFSFIFVFSWVCRFLKVWIFQIADHNVEMLNKAYQFLWKGGERNTTLSRFEHQRPSLGICWLNSCCP